MLEAVELEDTGAVISCGVPVLSETTGALAIAPTSAVTTGDAANTPRGAAVCFVVGGMNEYDSRMTGRRVLTCFCAGALYDGTRGSVGAA